MFIFKVFMVIYLLTLQLLLANSYCTKSLVPALYVFGDSTVDAGNNNNLNTPAKVNSFPYGIDFNNCLAMAKPLRILLVSLNLVRFSV